MSGAIWCFLTSGLSVIGTSPPVGVPGEGRSEALLSPSCTAGTGGKMARASRHYAVASAVNGAPQSVSTLWIASSAEVHKARCWASS